MYQAELTYFVIFSIVILLSSFLPTSVLLLLDSIVSRILIVILLLYLISIGPTAGIFGLIMVGLLYLERNRRKVEVAIKKLDKMDNSAKQYATVKEAGTSQQTVPVKPFQRPANDEVVYLPEEIDNSVFEPVGPSINQKEVLSTVYPLAGNESGSGSTELYEKLGFGHIEGVETLGES